MGALPPLRRPEGVRGTALASVTPSPAIAERGIALPARPDERPPARNSQSDRWQRIFVWACWTLIVASTSWFLLRAGRNIPIQEDWHVALAATGHQPHFWTWVWQPNNEHRVPIQKLIYVLLFRIWPDFRVGMVFNIALLSLTAGVFIAFMRRLRGQTRWTDAFFPVVLLHLGHWENIGWSWQLTFVFATAVACALLLMISSRRPWSCTRAMLAGGTLMLIPFTGATALPFAPIVAAALVIETRGLVGRPRQLILGFAAAAVLLSGAYFIGLPKSTWVPANPGMSTTLLTAGKLMALGLGPAAGAWWFLSIVGVLGAVASAAFILLRARIGGRRVLLGFLAAGAALAGATSKGRAGEVPYFGLPDRYALIAVPTLCAVYIVWDHYGGPRVRRFGPALLCCAIIGLLPLNVRYGAQWVSWYHQRVDVFAGDVKAGIPIDELDYYRPLALDPLEMWYSMLYLREDRIGVFASLQMHAKPLQGTPIDGFALGGGGWQVLADAAGTAHFTTRGGRRILEWDYHASATAPAAVGRVFGNPVDWRGAGAMAFTFTGQGTGRNIRVRIAMGAPDKRLELYDTSFVDTTTTQRTVTIPWNGFGRVDARGSYVQLDRRAMPQTNIRSFTFIVTNPDRGRLLLDGVRLLPGHAQIGWPLHPAVDRRSLPPWS